MSWLCCRLTFSLLQSAIQCIRGARSSCGLTIRSPPPIDLISVSYFSLFLYNYVLWFRCFEWSVFSDTAHNNYYIIFLLVCPCKKKKKKQKGHAKRRQLSCRDREDAYKLLSQGATANALAKKYVLELRRHCSSHSDACNRQVTDPVSPTASVEPRNSPPPKCAQESTDTFLFLHLLMPNLELLPGRT